MKSVTKKKKLGKETHHTAKIWFYFCSLVFAYIMLLAFISLAAQRQKPAATTHILFPAPIYPQTSYTVSGLGGHTAPPPPSQASSVLPAANDGTSAEGCEVTPGKALEIAEELALQAHDMKWSKDFLSPDVKSLDIDELIEFEKIVWEKRKSHRVSKLPLWDDLFLTEFETLEQSIDYQFAILLADASREYAAFKNSKGLCLKGVRLALNEVLNEYMKGNLPTKNLNELPVDALWKGYDFKKNSPGRSAETFRNWASKNPISLCFALGLADITGLDNLEITKGRIHLYAKGNCGFHPEFGHIEVLVDPRTGLACSDHCRITDTSCSPDMVLAPVKSCDWLVFSQRLQEPGLHDLGLHDLELAQ